MGKLVGFFSLVMATNSPENALKSKLFSVKMMIHSFIVELLKKKNTFTNMKKSFMCAACVALTHCVRKGSYKYIYTHRYTYMCVCMFVCVCVSVWVCKVGLYTKFTSSWRSLSIRSCIHVCDCLSKSVCVFFLVFVYVYVCVCSCVLKFYYMLCISKYIDVYLDTHTFTYMRVQFFVPQSIFDMEYTFCRKKKCSNVIPDSGDCYACLSTFRTYQLSELRDYAEVISALPLHL